MNWNLLFLFNSVLFGVGLAMDAFSVSLVNGLNEPYMKKWKMCGIAGIFAFFQGLMPLAGWICVHTILQYFQMVERLIPWIALILLLFIGGKMLLEGLRNQDSDTEMPAVGIGALMVQGIATSIDALSVGFTIANYDFPMAFMCVTIIAAVTFVICMIGLVLGKMAGTKFSSKATILGGVILIVIGIEIFLTSGPVV